MKRNKKIMHILELLDHFSFAIKYRENEVFIHLHEFLREYENGISFIDYLYDFYYLQELYSYSRSENLDEYKISIESSKTYYYSWLLFKFILTEVKKCLLELEEYDIKEFNFREFVLGERFEYIEPDGNGPLEVTFEGYNPDFLEEIIDAIRASSNGLLKLALLDILMYEICEEKDVRPINSFDQFLRDLEKNIKNMLSLFEDFTFMHYRADSSSLNLFYKMNLERWEWFAQMINNSRLVSAIEELSNNNKRKLNCCALAIIGESEYYTINGLDEEKFTELKRVFNQLFNKNEKYVSVSDGVRYFLSDKIEYITYKQFVNNEHQYQENRMFTCCERKLFAEIRRQKKFDNDIQIIVTNQPCVYCLREIQNIEKNYNKIRIITNPEDANNNKMTPENEIVARHDLIAEEIWNNNH